MLRENSIYETVCGGKNMQEVELAADTEGVVGIVIDHTVEVIKVPEWFPTTEIAIWEVSQGVGIGAEGCITNR